MKSVQQQAHPNRFWLWDLMQAGHGIRHFVTVAEDNFQAKLYFTSALVIAVFFHGKEHLFTSKFVRGPYDSLLSYEGKAMSVLQSLPSN